MSIKETAQVYSTLFMGSFPEFKITKPLKTIELFAGYGSQSLALDYLGVGHESVGICEWAIPSFIACGFGTAKKYSEMTEIEKAKADLDYAKRKGGFAYKQAVAHYKKVLRNSWKGDFNVRIDNAR